ncbi:response regulator transcription factor [Shewanella sp. GXUN23E]|uniref:response regulator transcription factor n=1 Tax=Shewanella sp. GXUN23E TaxID=3422498 RepID=UPI003D7CC101
MDTTKELVFLHQIAAPCHLAMLAESMGVKTRVVSHVNELDLNYSENCFYLVSQHGAALDNQGIPLIVTRLVPHVPVALYQVEAGSIALDSLLLMGVRGVLYADQRMDLLLTGLRKMLSDELWFDRPMMSRMLRQLVQKLEGNAPVSADHLAMLQALTKRERTIIQMVGSGARNKEIAHRLCISEHTVKAHLSSIFRKTQSRNRVELLRWAQSHHNHFDLVS